MNVMDADAVRFLKIFTFLSLDEIEEIRKQFEAAPHERLAQKVLAREVVTLVHGEEAYKEALNITDHSLQETLRIFLLKSSNKDFVVYQTTKYKQTKTTISWNSSCHLVWLTQNAKPVKTSKTELSTSTATASKTLTMS